jgi:hypothetical protein
MRNRQANIRNSTCIASIAIIIVGILWEKLREKMKNGKLLILAILLPKQPKVTEDKSPTVCTVHTNWSSSPQRTKWQKPQ